MFQRYSTEFSWIFFGYYTIYMSVAQTIDPLIFHWCTRNLPAQYRPGRTSVWDRASNDINDTGWLPTPILWLEGWHHTYGGQMCTLSEPIFTAPTWESITLKTYNFPKGWLICYDLLGFFLVYIHLFACTWSRSLDVLLVLVRCGAVYRKLNDIIHMMVL